MRPVRLLLGGALVVALLVGCSDDPPGPGGGGNGGGGAGTGGVTTPTSESAPDPCTLVTKDAVSAAVGGEVGDGVSELVSAPGFENGRQCSFRTSDGRGRFSLEIYPVTPELFAIDKQQEKGFGDVEDIAGLGEEAFRVGYNSVHVFTGEYLVKLGLGQLKFDPDTSMQHLKSLAQASLAKL
jgi:hypothetical protein